MKPLLIYNLFPRLYKNTREWEKSVDKIIEMGFNSIFLNPFHYTGFSGSLYAVKDYYKYNDLFFTPDKSPEDQLADFLRHCNQKKINVFMDLVVNHTSKDSVLVERHRDWYVLDEKNELVSPGAWDNGIYVTWGDLAELDIENSPDKDNLWKYMLDVCLYYLRLGFTGFRCDAAYQIDDEFWEYLITNVRKEKKDVIFLAETLGCTPVQIQALSSCGFDYIFNSSKWWNYEDEWCLEQYDMNRINAPSISFPETHDTERLMLEVNENEKIFLQKLYFTAIFSKGFMIPTGFEYGFKKRMNVVTMTYHEWEHTKTDYSGYIKNILSIKQSLRPLSEESSVEVIAQPNNVFCFIKEWEDERVLVCINKDHIKSQEIYFENLEELLKTDSIKDYSPENRMDGFLKSLNIKLLPSELKIIAGERYYKI